MKKTIASLLAALMLVGCAVNTNVRGTRISNKIESSSVLLKIKVRLTVKDFDTGEKKEVSGWGTCSGVYVKDNIILSAAHCVDVPKGMTLKEIWIKNGSQSEKAVVIKVDPKADLALLYTPLEGTPIKLAKHVKRGEDCWVVGNPLGLQDILTKGIVSSTRLVVKEEKASFLIVDAIVLPGNSGGPVINSDCELIGILTRSTSFLGFLGASGLGIAVDLQTIRAFLK